MGGTPRIRGGIGADEEYWLALERGEFMLSRCGDCHAWIWPAHFRCGHCGSWKIGWEAVEPVGNIYTWTRNHAVSEAIAERRDMVPYVTLLVELPGADGARVAGVFDGDVETVRIGDRVRGKIRPADDVSKGYVTMTWVPEESA